jgi:hypothetical protein
MKAKFSLTQKITFAAMLLVLGVFSTMVFKYISIPGLGFVRFSLTPAIIIYSSLTLGPLYGAVVGVCSDLIPALVTPYGVSTAINPLITIVYGLLGIMPWALEKLTKHFRSVLKKPWILYGLLAAILAGVAGIFYGTNLLDAGLGSNPILVKSILLGVFALLDVGLGFGLYFTNKYFQKRILDLTDIPSPNEIAFISVICEIVLMVILKSLAFYVFYTWMNGGEFKPAFTYIFASLLFASSLNVLINTFAVSWMMIFTRRFIHAYGYPTIKEEGAPGSAADDNDLLAKQEGKHMNEEQDETKEDEANQKKAKIGWILFFTILALVMIACIIVIAVLKK